MSDPGCKVVHTAEAYEGKQGLSYFAGVSAENTGAQALCLHLLVIPPGGRAKAHLHEHHESAIYVVSGEADTWCGEELSEHLVVGPGDFIYIPPVCRTCPSTAAERSQLRQSSRASIPTSRRASYSCQTSTLYPTSGDQRPSNGACIASWEGDLSASWRVSTVSV